LNVRTVFMLGFLGCAALVALDFTGCSSSSAGGVSAAKACADEAQSNCGRLDSCLMNGTALEYGDIGTCYARQAAECTASLASSGTGRTPANEETCAQQIPNASCTDFLNNNTPPACQPPAGALATGAGCAFSAQCASSFCALPRTSVCGTCQPQPAAGASCATLSGCGQGLECVLDTCVALATSSGASCTPAQPCGTGLSCVTPAKATTGTCQMAASTVGAPCDPKRVMGPGCDSSLGLYCDQTAKTCATDAYVSSGVCDTDFDVLKVSTPCTGGATCYKNACVAPAADGQPCNTALGIDCLRPARCVGVGVDGGTMGMCALPGSMQCQ
jgi:hypothetical protein